MLDEFLLKVPPLTIIALLSIIIVWIYFFFYKFTATTVSNAPTILTSMGILGTFLGVAFGLFDFNPSEIQESVPQLIEGLKTAFWSSVAGVSFALTIKIRHLIVIHRKKEEGTSHGANIDDIVDGLRDINKSLVGDEEASLVTQVKLTRQDSNDKLEAIRRSMDSYLKEMAKSNSEALIEALREVIKDFNARINEQFGDNFKQLNEAVGKILDWQEKYREQMEEMIDQQETVTNNMKQAVEQYGTFINKSEIFVTLSEELSNIIKALEMQREHLHSSIESLAKLIDATKTGLPEIEDRIKKMVEEIASGFSATASTMKETVERIDNELNQHVRTMTENTRNQVAELDKALTDELTRSLETFGAQLASLSEKFVADYGPLTEKLRQVVSISRGL